MENDNPTPYRGSRWMGDLSEADRRRPLEDLVLPGSRASAACKVLGPPAKAGLKRRLSMTRKAGREAADRVTVTQRLDVLTQLDAGVRAVDLKVSAFSGQLYVSRTYLIAPLVATLETLRMWLEGSPTEYLEVRIFWDGRSGDREVALVAREEVRDLLDGVLATTTANARQGLTLENAAGKMVAVWGLDGPQREEGLARWDLKTISARSATPEVAVGRIAKYLRHVEGFPNDARLKVLPLVTEDPDGKRSSLDLAREMRPVVDEYLKSPMPVHVIEIDDVDSEFVRAVIALNRFGSEA